MGLFYSTGEEKQKEQKSSDGGGLTLSDSEWTSASGKCKHIMSLNFKLS